MWQRSENGGQDDLPGEQTDFLCDGLWCDREKRLKNDHSVLSYFYGGGGSGGR